MPSPAEKTPEDAPLTHRSETVDAEQDDNQHNSPTDPTAASESDTQRLNYEATAQSKENISDISNAEQTAVNQTNDNDSDNKASKVSAQADSKSKADETNVPVVAEEKNGANKPASEPNPADKQPPGMKGKQQHPLSNSSRAPSNAPSPSAPTDANSSNNRQSAELTKILVEMKALKAALPTQNEVAMVFAQDAIEGAKLQSYCRGMIRRMQELEKQRRAFAEEGSVEQRRQTVIQKARQRREEEHMHHVKEFMLKEALRMDKKEEKVENQTEEVVETRQRKDFLKHEADQKRREMEAERVLRLEERVAKWREHADKVAAEKAKELQKAQELKSRRMEALSNGAAGSIGFLLPNGQVPANTSGGAFRAASMRTGRTASNNNQKQAQPKGDMPDETSTNDNKNELGASTSSQPNDDQDGYADDGHLLHTDRSEVGGERRSSAAAEEGKDNHHPSDRNDKNGRSEAVPPLTREEFELMERNAKLEKEYEINMRMASHIRRSGLVKLHRQFTAKKMTERTANIPAFKQKLAEESEEAYQAQLAKDNEENEKLELFLQQKEKIRVEKMEKNRLKQLDAQRRIREAQLTEEQRFAQFEEKLRQKEKEREQSVARARDASVQRKRQKDTVAAAHPSSEKKEEELVKAKISKLAQKLMERTERVAALYAVEPVAAEPPRAPRPVPSPKKEKEVVESPPSPKKAQPAPSQKVAAPSPTTAPPPPVVVKKQPEPTTTAKKAPPQPAKEKAKTQPEPAAVVTSPQKPQKEPTQVERQPPTSSSPSADAAVKDEVKAQEKTSGDSESPHSYPSFQLVWAVSVDAFATDKAHDATAAYCQRHDALAEFADVCGLLVGEHPNNDIHESHHGRGEVAEDNTNEEAEQEAVSHPVTAADEEPAAPSFEHPYVAAMNATRPAADS